jgi:hypothetical protein
MCCLRVFRVVVRVFSPTCRVQSCTHLWCVCVWVGCPVGGGDRRGGRGGRGGGSSRSISLLFFQTPRPLTPLVRAPRPRYLCFTSRVLFPSPPLAMRVLCPARMWCLRRRVYLILGCVCVWFVQMITRKRSRRAAASRRRPVR